MRVWGARRIPAVGKRTNHTSLRRCRRSPGPAGGGDGRRKRPHDHRAMLATRTARLLQGQIATGIDKLGPRLYVMGRELSREPAQVAELVDALVSGTSAFTGVEVRVLSWAPPTKIPK